LETTDNFCRRIQGFMLFYGAYTQCDNSRHPHGINHAWAWASRLVNRVPPNRFSVSFCLYLEFLFILVWAM
jgi:nucleoporin GLE1